MYVKWMIILSSMIIKHILMNYDAFMRIDDITW